MHVKTKSLQIVPVALLLLCFGAACLAHQSTTETQRGIPADRLAYYADPFESFRPELWDKAGYLFTAEEMANFKPADMRFGENGLVIETVPGSFSKGGLGSKYVLRGDFEIEIECHMEFHPLLQGMDQVLLFTVLDEGKELQQLDSISIGLFKKGGQREGFLTSGYQKSGKYYRGSSRRVSSFSGFLKIRREGGKISTYFRKGDQKDWKKADTFRLTDSDMGIGFLAQNYMGGRKEVSTDETITATFRNFRINGAHQIVEPEI